MQHLFLNKELSLLAKEKGWEEYHFAYYAEDISYPFNEETQSYNIPSHNGVYLIIYDYDEKFKVSDEQLADGEQIPAPLYQQILDWFREKHRIDISIDLWRSDIYLFNYAYLGNDPKYLASSGDNYYEALNKAVEEAFKLI